MNYPTGSNHLHLEQYQTTSSPSGCVGSTNARLHLSSPVFPHCGQDVTTFLPVPAVWPWLPEHIFSPPFFCKSANKNQPLLMAGLILYLFILYRLSYNNKTTNSVLRFMVMISCYNYVFHDNFIILLKIFLSIKYKIFGIFSPKSPTCFEFIVIWNLISLI